MSRTIELSYTDADYLKLHLFKGLNRPATPKRVAMLMKSIESDAVLALTVVSFNEKVYIIDGVGRYCASLGIRKEYLARESLKKPPTLFLIFKPLETEREIGNMIVTMNTTQTRMTFDDFTEIGIALGQKSHKIAKQLWEKDKSVQQCLLPQLLCDFPHKSMAVTRRLAEDAYKRCNITVTRTDYVELHEWVCEMNKIIIINEARNPVTGNTFRQKAQRWHNQYFISFWKRAWQKGEKRKDEILNKFTRRLIRAVEDGLVLPSEGHMKQLFADIYSNRVQKEIVYPPKSHV